MSECNGCGGSCGTCGSCGGCGGGNALELSEGEIFLLKTLSQIPFLPVARKMGDDIPVYLEDDRYTREEYTVILQCLEKRGLISIDYDRPLKDGYRSAYDKYPIKGSVTMTAGGHQVLEIIEIQGVQ